MRGASSSRVPLWAGTGLWVLLAAVLPSLGTLGAGWISDDAVILGYVHRGGSARDWLGPQYDLVTVTFWRPLVTASWALQEALFGVWALPYRVLNLAGHALAALCAAGIVRLLGGGRTGALAAGLAFALFPEQGGTVTWVAGRVDSLTLPFFAGALLAALGRRPVLAAAAAFAACASKETAFVLPGWALALGWALGSPEAPGAPGRAQAAGARWRSAVRVALPVFSAVLLAFLWRRAALGAWIGGYPASGPGLLGSLAGFAGTLGEASAVTLAAVGALGFAALRRGPGGRADTAVLLGACLACAVGGALPLFALLADGTLEAQNARALGFWDLGLCLTLGVATSRLFGEGAASAAAPAEDGARPLGPGRAGRPGLATAGFLVLGLALGWRARAAWTDTHEWARAAERADDEVARARAALERAGPVERGERGEPGPLPLLVPAPPQTHGGAYCLGLGLADRFRAPFPEAERGVWPWRLVFGNPEERPAAVRPALGDAIAGGAGALVPFAPGAPRPEGAPPELPLRRAAGTGPGPLPVDERVVLAEPDESPALELDVPEAAQLEVLLCTEMGYEPFPWPGGPIGAGGAGARLSLMRAFLGSNGHATMADAAIWSASLGATHAFLEVRATGEGGVRSSSGWVELSIPRAALDLAR